MRKTIESVRRNVRMKDTIVWKEDYAVTTSVPPNFNPLNPTSFSPLLSRLHSLTFSHTHTHTHLGNQGSGRAAGHQRA